MLDLSIVAPMFFADPAGAIIGKLFSKHVPRLNPRWIGEKTVWGSTAVFIFTFFSIFYPVTLMQRLLVSVIAMVAEAVGGDYDNLLLVLAVLGGYIVIHGAAISASVSDL